MSGQTRWRLLSLPDKGAHLFKHCGGGESEFFVKHLVGSARSKAVETENLCT